MASQNPTLAQPFLGLPIHDGTGGACRLSTAGVTQSKWRGAKRRVLGMVLICLVGAGVVGLTVLQSATVQVPLHLCSPNHELCIDIGQTNSASSGTASAVSASFVATYAPAPDIPMTGKVGFTFAPENTYHSFSAPTHTSSAVLESSWSPLGGSQRTFSGSYIETNVTWEYTTSTGAAAASTTTTTATAVSSSLILQFRLYDHILSARVVYGSDNAGTFDAAFGYNNVDRHLDATVYADHGDEIGAYKTDGDHRLSTPGKVHQTPVSIDLKKKANGQTR
jgi:hypothetical protein